MEGVIATMTNFTSDSKIAFVGGGTVGRTLAHALHSQGYPVIAAASRTFTSAQAVAAEAPGCIAYGDIGEAASAADFVFITTTDDAIEEVSSKIAWRTFQGVAHCSGAASLDVLKGAQDQGAAIGAFHPLQTFSAVDEALKRVPGSTFAIEGDDEMCTYLRGLALALGGNPIVLRPEDKPLYHASVVMMGGLLTATAGAVAGMWRHFGIGRDEAIRALAPIVIGSGGALQSAGVPGGLAGPYVRGDVGTVNKHLDALRTSAPELLPVYCSMALAGLDLVLEKGNVPAEIGSEIREMLEDESCKSRRQNS